jgi:hypothetical protein
MPACAGILHDAGTAACEVADRPVAHPSGRGLQHRWLGAAELAARGLDIGAVPRRRSRDAPWVDQSPTMLPKRQAIRGLGLGDVRRQFELEPGAAGQVEIFEECRPFVVLVELAVDDVVAAVAVPPMRHRGVVRSFRVLRRPCRQMDGRPHAVPGDAAVRDGAIGLADALADRDMQVVLADAHVRLSRPELQHPGIDVVENGAGEFGALRPRHVIVEVEEDARPHRRPDVGGAQRLDGD